MHESALQQINDIEGFEVHIGPLPVERPEEETSIEAPRFSRPLGGRVEANQEEAVHFEARVLPANDIKMKVECKQIYLGSVSFLINSRVQRRSSTARSPSLSS